MLAHHIGISRPYLSDIENCKRQLSGQVMLKIARYLEVPVEEIFFADNVHDDGQFFEPIRHDFDREDGELMDENQKNVVRSAAQKYVTVSDAARHWRVSRNTVYEACREKEITFLKIRSSLRVLIDTGEQYLTVGEAARLLHASPSTVYAACALGCQEGTIPHIRIRSRIRIPKSRLMDPAPSFFTRDDGQLPPAASILPSAVKAG
ncbi:MAG: helix-turn-helix domain-containing protein [Syntrophomonadaceae bacterium]